MNTLRVLPVFLLAGCIDGGSSDTDSGPSTATPVYSACAEEAAVIESLKPTFGSVVTDWQVIRLDPDAIERAAVAGDQIVLPAMTAQGESYEIEVTAAVSDTKGPSVGTLRGDDGTIQEVEIPPIYSYTLGCDSSDDACGAFTFFDPAGGQGSPTSYEGVLMSTGAGNLYFESAETLYANMTGQRPQTELFDPACGVVYNAAFHAAIADDIDQLKDEDVLQDEDCGFINAEVNIILDADTTYYDLNPSTVWSRQRSLFNTTQIVYALLEPLLGGSWSLLLNLESQESWVSGGPTETSSQALSDEINDSGYYMINHPTDNEVSYYYVGYDLDGGSAGIAGGICGYDPYDDTFGSTVANQRNHALGQQIADSSGYAFSTLHGRQVVMIHELGHMFGGLHSDGLNNATRTNGIFSATGTTVMKSGASGGVAPDDRGMFFSEENSENICACLDRVF